MRVSKWALMAAIALAACSPEQAPPSKQAAAVTVPDSFKVTMETSRGPVVIEVYRAWAPLGAERFYALVQDGFFSDERFFRTIPGFVAQFGLSGDPKKNEPWDKKIADDSVKQTNARGTLVFATEGRNTRTHQLFINLHDNARLDRMGFAPIGKVVQGMDAVDSLYGGYDDAPDQHFIQTMGNSYLNRVFPKLDYIKSASVTP